VEDDCSVGSQRHRLKKNQRENQEKKEITSCFCKENNQSDQAD